MSKQRCTRPAAAVHAHLLLLGTHEIISVAQAVPAAATVQLHAAVEIKAALKQDPKATLKLTSDPPLARTTGGVLATMTKYVRQRP